MDRRSISCVASETHTLWELDFDDIQSVYISGENSIYVWGTDDGGATIARIDPNGYWAWKHKLTHYFPGVAGWGSFCETGDGSLLFRPKKGIYVALDALSGIKWIASVGGPQEIVYVEDRLFAEGGAIWHYGEGYAVRRPDGKGGWQVNGNPRLQRIGPDGRVEKSLPVAKPGGYDLWSMDINNAGDFIIVWIDEDFFESRRRVEDTDADDTGIIVACYDARMNNRWDKKINGLWSGFDIVVAKDGVYLGICVDKWGGVNIVTIQGIPATTEGQSCFLSVKLDFAGNVAWKYRADASEDYFGDLPSTYAPTIGFGGEMYIYGYDLESFDLKASITVKRPRHDPLEDPLEEYPEENFFVARIGTDGRVDWVNTFAMDGYFEVVASRDGSGNLYVYGKVGLDPIQIGDKSIPGSFGHDKWYLAIIDRDGNCTRIKVFDDWGELHCLTGDSSVYFLRGQDSEEWIAYDDQQTGPTDAFAQIKIYDTVHDRVQRKVLDCDSVDFIESFIADGLGGCCFLTSSFPPKHSYEHCEISDIVMLDKDLKVVLKRELALTEAVYGEEGNLYVLGYMEGFMWIETPLFGSAPAEAYLAKIAPSGEILWFKRCVDFK